MFLQLEDGLTYEHLLGRGYDLKPEELDVFIPKFSLEKSLEALKYLDLPDLTDPSKANLAGATTTKNVALKQLVHGAFIEIDEEGGEEAEEHHYPRYKRHQETPKIVVNKPFLYYVRQNKTQSIVLLGRFSKPE